MSEKDQDKEGAAAAGAQTPNADNASGTPQVEKADGGLMPSYRKAEEDSTSLAEEERTGEGTGARAGEYS